MDLLHHQAALREEDGVWICSRCGLVNPTDDQPCIPTVADPSLASAAPGGELETVG